MRVCYVSVYMHVGIYICACECGVVSICLRGFCYPGRQSGRPKTRKTIRRSTNTSTNTNTSTRRKKGKRTMGTPGTTNTSGTDTSTARRRVIRVTLRGKMAATSRSESAGQMRVTSVAVAAMVRLKNSTCPVNLVKKVKGHQWSCAPPLLPTVQ